MNDIAKGHVFFIYQIPHWIVCFANVLGNMSCVHQVSPLFQYLLRLFQVPSYAFSKRTGSPALTHHSVNIIFLRTSTPQGSLDLRPEDGLTIQNPEGYSSEYLLHAAKLLVDLDMKTLIKSMGKTLEIEQARSRGLVIFLRVATLC